MSNGTNDGYDRVLNSGAESVLVAIIGESRSALSVCRNIVSGCQTSVTLKKDAEGAVEAACVLLIED